MAVSTKSSTFTSGIRHKDMGAKDKLIERFKNESTGTYIDIHRPHPGSIMKEWMIKTIYLHLKSYGFIK